MSVQTLPLAVRRGARVGNWIEVAGYRCLLLLAVALPYEMAYRPLVGTGALVLTNLKLVFYVTACAAGLTLLPRGRALLGALRRGDPVSADPLYRRRAAVAVVLALVCWAIVSSLFGNARGTGLKWSFDLLPGIAIWLAIPYWFGDDTDRRMVWLTGAALAGAAGAALLGIAEVISGPGLDAALAAFKPGPTYAGPYLRLSGPFQYANIAAAYFALCLPVVVSVFAGHGKRWPRGYLRGSRSARTGQPGAIAISVALVLLGGLLLAALLLTSSRGGLAAALAGCGVVAVALRRSLWPVSVPARAFVLLALSLVLLAGALLLALSPLTPLRATSEGGSQWYRASYVVSLPRSLPTGQVRSARVRVTNESPFAWSGSGAHPFHFSYHWLLSSGRVAVFEGLRSSLGTPIAPGMSRSLTVRVLAPARPGHYRFVPDIVEEHVAWFAAQTGEYVSLPVNVTGPTRPLADTGSAPSALAMAPAQPPRSALWAAALRMIRTHPLLGVGPDAFRLTYGVYARPRQTTWNTRIYANNFFLEMAADLGIVGALLFFTFFALAVWPVVRRVLRGRPSPWEAAVAGVATAYLVHGGVDYLLGAHAILYAFWLVCGLAGIGAASTARTRIA